MWNSLADVNASHFYKIKECVLSLKIEIYYLYLCTYIYSSGATLNSEVL